MKQSVVLVLAAILLVPLGLSAQDDKELSRKERKALQQQLDSLKFLQAFSAIEDKEFVLEADRVIFKQGQTAYVSSNTNFVAVSGERAVVQVAFNVPSGGPNGIGGVTVEGSVTKFDMQTDDKGKVTVSMNVMGRGISAMLMIELYKGSNRAQVTVTPNFNSSRLTLSGVVVASEESNVFKATPL